jgi:hypothetical protein
LDELKDKDDLDNKQKRFQAYRKAVGKREKLPECVECSIKDIWPEKNYVGYREKK